MACLCNLVGNLDIGYRGVQSIDISHHRDTVTLDDGSIGTMPIITTITISAYPRQPGEVFRPSTCQVSLNASFAWTRIYDCDVDKMFYIYNDKSNINYTGDLPEFIQVFNSVSAGTALKASAASGPYTPYLEAESFVASDMAYTGNPIQFDTRINSGLNGFITVAGYKVVLKSFSYSRSTDMEIVNYTFEGAEQAEVMLPTDKVDDSC